MGVRDSRSINLLHKGAGALLVADVEVEELTGEDQGGGKSP